MKAVPVAVGAVLVDGKLPLIQFKRNIAAGYWALPGGKFDPGEFAVEALERELSEEIEQAARFKELMAIVDEDTNNPAAPRITLYVCTADITGSVSTATIDKEEGRIQWFSLDEIEALRPSMLPSDYEFIRQLLVGGDRGYYKSRLTYHPDRVTLDFFDRVTGIGDRQPTPH